jgi:hypothetical protein
MTSSARSFIGLSIFYDILIYSSLWLKHRSHINLVVVRRSKCSFDERSVAYLGHVISVDGVAIDAQKVEAMLD